MKKSTNLGQKTVLIAGAAGAVGGILAKRFADLGATVVVIDEDETALHEIARYQPNRIEPLCLDLRKAKSCRMLGEAWGGAPIHFLFNLQNYTENLGEVVRCIEGIDTLNRALFPALVAADGAVVVLCPVRRGMQGDAIVAATTKMVAAYARDYAADGVRMNALLLRREADMASKGLMNALMFFGQTKVINGAVVEVGALKPNK